MILQPKDLDELGRALALAHANAEKISAIELTSLNRLVEHVPEDMTATVEAGITLAALQEELARRGQWLPIDPPHSDRLTIGELLSRNPSGPRRYGCGTVRDYVIGMRVALADGRIIKSGGKVVKNVAGYDLCKLFIGSGGTLGVIAEATFKLKPLPETEAFVQAQARTIEEVDSQIQAILDSDLTPVVFDIHNINPLRAPVLVLGFAGAREDVEYQLGKAKNLGVGAPSSLEYEIEFWSNLSFAAARRVSVLPSEVTAFVRRLKDNPYVARAGNGAICHLGGLEARQADLPETLFRRVKDAFDPKHILPE